MGHIHHHANPVHFFDNFTPHAGQACIIIFITTRRQERLIVIGQLHEPRAQAVQNFDQANIIFNRGWVLKAKDHRCFAGGFCGFYISRGIGQGDDVMIVFKPPVPLFHIGNGFAEHFMIRNGHMDTINPAFAPLIKNLWRPIAILQPIDQHDTPLSKSGEMRLNALS